MTVKRMDAEQANVEADSPDSFVQLSEQRDGWSVDVSPNGRPAVLHSLHASAEEALPVAIALAVARRVGLLILTKSNESLFVPATDVERYAWSLSR